MNPHPTQAVLSATPQGVALRVKVVPGASRTKLANILGDRLKITLATPPQDGKANLALCQFISSLFGIPLRHVVITQGHRQPQKTIELISLDPTTAVQTLHRLLNP